MSNSEKSRRQALALATEVGAKTARACDICLQVRARWYCAADDAFLCQSCDSAVHSANSLPRRHERVRINTSSTSSAFTARLAFDEMLDDGPTWHRRCKRTARTPRGGGGKEDPKRSRLKIGAIVPEVGTPSEECAAQDRDEQLIHRVPIYDPVLSEFRSLAAASDDVKSGEGGSSRPVIGNGPSEGLPGLNAIGADLFEFEIDVESLLGQGLDEHSCCMEGLGLNLMDSPGAGSGSGGGEICSPAAHCRPVKEEEMYVYGASADIKFDCGSPWAGGGGDMSDDDNKAFTVAEEGKKRKIMLNLDYESVITAWSGKGSPWTDGERPTLHCGDCFPSVMGMTWAGGAELQGGAFPGGNGVSRAIAGDGGREARVSRYREKRRTRLFSKKIRYEVRKLNAEKRPRMKGRFVKRASIAASTTTVASAMAAVAAPQYVF